MRLRGHTEEVVIPLEVVHRVVGGGRAARCSAVALGDGMDGIGLRLGHGPIIQVPFSDCKS